MANQGGTTGIPLVPSTDEGIFFEALKPGADTYENKIALPRKQFYL